MYIPYLFLSVNNFFVDNSNCLDEDQVSANGYQITSIIEGENQVDNAILPGYSLPCGLHPGMKAGYDQVQVECFKDLADIILMILQIESGFLPVLYSFFLSPF